MSEEDSPRPAKGLCNQSQSSCGSSQLFVVRQLQMKTLQKKERNCCEKCQYLRHLMFRNTSERAGWYVCATYSWIYKAKSLQKPKKTKAGSNIFDRRKQTPVWRVYSPALKQDVGGITAHCGCFGVLHAIEY